MHAVIGVESTSRLHLTEITEHLACYRRREEFEVVPPNHTGTKSMRRRGTEHVRTLETQFPTSSVHIAVFGGTKPIPTDGGVVEMHCEMAAMNSLVGTRQPYVSFVLLQPDLRFTLGKSLSRLVEHLELKENTLVHKHMHSALEGLIATVRLQFGEQPSETPTTQ